MNSNGSKMPSLHTAVPIIGQPVTVLEIMVPVSAKLQCHCGANADPILIMSSQAAACAGCGKLYNVSFNPSNGQIQIAIGIPVASEIPS